MAAGVDLRGSVDPSLYPIVECIAEEFDEVKDKIVSEQKRYTQSASEIERDIKECEETLSAFMINTKKELLSLKVPSYQVCSGADTKIDQSEIPERICIGHYVQSVSGCKLLNDLNLQNGLNIPLFLDVRKGSNVVIRTGRTNDLLQIDRIVAGLTMKYVESFPSCLKVHIFDVLNGSWPIAAASSKLPIHVERDQSFLEEVVAESNRISEQIETNLFDALKSESTLDKMQLVVIRSGFSKIKEDGLQIIGSLVGDAGTGKRSGVRMIIVDDTTEDDQPGHYGMDLQEYRSNILSDFVRIDFRNGCFYFNLCTATLTSIDGDLMSSVRANCERIKRSLENNKTRNISFEDVGFGKTFDVCHGPDLSIPVGVTGKRIFNIDLSCIGRDNYNISYMVLGMPGSGKSFFFHDMILNGCMKYSPADLNFWLLDGKFATTSSEYSGSLMLPHIKVISKKNDAEDAKIILLMAVAEMERRANLFIAESGGADKDIVAYNQGVSTEKRLPRILIMIDELGTIIDDATTDSNNTVSCYVDDSSGKEVVGLITQLAKQSRFSGIHLVLFSQNLSGSRTRQLTGDGSFLTQRCGRISFKVSALDLSSSYGRDIEGAEGLDVGTACYWDGDGRMTRFRTAASDDRTSLRRRIMDKYKDYPTDCMIVGDDSPWFVDRKAFLDLYQTGRKSDYYALGLNDYNNTIVSISSHSRCPPTLAIMSTPDSINMRDSLIKTMVESSICRGEQVVVCIDPYENHDLSKYLESIVGIKTYDNMNDFLQEQYLTFQERYRSSYNSHPPVNIFIIDVDLQMIGMEDIPSLEMPTSQRNGMSNTVHPKNPGPGISSNGHNSISGDILSMRSVLSTVKKESMDYKGYLNAMLTATGNARANMPISFTLGFESMSRYNQWIQSRSAQCYCGWGSNDNLSNDIRRSMFRLQSKGFKNHAIVKMDGFTGLFKPIMWKLT